jgi:hypothetical protein
MHVNILDHEPSWPGGLSVQHVFGAYWQSDPNRPDPKFWMSVSYSDPRLLPGPSPGWKTMLTADDREDKDYNGWDGAFTTNIAPGWSRTLSPCGDSCKFVHHPSGFFFRT